MRRDHARALAAYTEHLVRRGVSPRTRDLYLLTARRFVASLGALPLRRLARGQVEAFMAGRAGRLSPAVRTDECYRLGAFLRALVALGLLPEDPAAGIMPPGRPPYGVQVVLSEAGVARLLDAASRAAEQARPLARAAALRDRALLEVLYGLGLRASEAGALRLVDLDLGGQALLVHRAKGGGEAALPLPPACVPPLRRYVEDGRPALAARGRGADQGRLLLTNVGTPMDGRRVAEAVARVARRAGLRAHAHALRRSLATHLVRAGAPVPAVQALLGHQRIDTTAVYVDVERDDLRRAVEVLERLRGRAP